MKQHKHILIAILAAVSVLAGCEKEPVSGKHKSIATSLAKLSDGTMFSIEPESPYGSENSNYYISTK
ncbi:MAG: hypothetical protein IJ205_06720 [Bacteroidales bacterium]|nr:hypothetical protein [Bacteroidales bacterium]